MFNIIPLIQRRMMFTPAARTHGQIFYGQDGYDSNLQDSLSGDLVADIENRVKDIVQTEMSEAIYKFLERQYRLASVEADLREFDFFTWEEENRGAVENWITEPYVERGATYRKYHLKLHVEIGIKRNYVYNEQARILQPDTGTFTDWRLRGVVR